MANPTDFPPRSTVSAGKRLSGKKMREGRKEQKERENVRTERVQKGQGVKKCDRNARKEAPAKPEEIKHFGGREGGRGA